MIRKSGRVACRSNMEHHTAGTVPLVANPIKLSETPVQYRQAPPVLGEHTRAVLADALGMSEAQIDELVRQGVV